jgi:hypothetical protein
MDAQAIGPVGMEVEFSSYVNPDYIYVLSGQPPPADVVFDFSKNTSWFRRDGFGDLQRVEMLASLHPKTKTLHRPSWLHPFRRILWVHHHGPQMPSVEVPVIDFNSYGVIKGVA